MNRPAEAFARACAMAAGDGYSTPGAEMGRAGAETGRQGVPAPGEGRSTGPDVAGVPGRLSRADIEAEAREMCRRDGHDPDVVPAIDRGAGTGPASDNAVPLWWEYRAAADTALRDRAAARQTGDTAP